MDTPGKNVAEGSFQELPIESDFILLKASSESQHPVRMERPAHRRFLQFHFCLKGQAQFVYHGGHYVIDLPRDMSLLLYNPETELPLQVVLGPDTRMLSVLMSIQKFHSLFTSYASFIPFLIP